MVVLGLLLVAAAAVFGTEAVLSNPQTTTGEAFNQTAAGVSAAEFFLAGAGTGLLLLLGLLMIFGGFGRRRAHRAQVRHAVSEQRREVEMTEGELAAVAEENDRLRRELEEERLDRETMGGVAVPPGLADTRFEPYPGMATQAMPEPAPADERERLTTRTRGK